MVKFLRDLPIPIKLTLLTAASTTLALLVAGVSLFVNDIRLMRLAKVEQLSALGEVFVVNSTTALSFGQNDSVNELLASLRFYPTVSNARVIDVDGAVLAVYSQNEEYSFYQFETKAVGHKYTDGGFLELTLPIVEDGEELGRLQIVDSMQDVNEKYAGYMTVMGAVLLVSLVIGLGLTFPLQRSISRPILELASTAQMISLETDFLVRVQCDSEDEIGVLYEEFNKMMESVQSSGERARKANSALQKLNDDLENRVQNRTRMLEKANTQLQQEMVERDLATVKLREAQDQLIETSRKAGMADVANGVLHNVGNVLNSLNVSASVIESKVRDLAIGRLRQCVDLMNENESDIGRFMQESPKGQMLPKYLTSLSEKLEKDRTLIATEITSLEKSVEHIKQIVRAQQSYAGSFGVVEQSSPVELMEDALQFVSDSIERHHITLIKEYQEVPNIEIEKSRLIQMLVNLIKNAKESILIQGDTKMEMVLRVEPAENDFVSLSVIDTGVGIAPEKLTAIFSQGYTTKKDGHGFGLHAPANAAKEMGGVITVDSPGLGLGATFTILLPRQRPVEAKRKPELLGHATDAQSIPAALPDLTNGDAPIAAEVPIS